MVELADTADSKSAAGNSVRVQVPSIAPSRYAGEEAQKAKCWAAGIIAKCLAAGRKASATGSRTKMLE